MRHFPFCFLLTDKIFDPNTENDWCKKIQITKGKLICCLTRKTFKYFPDLWILQSDWFWTQLYTGIRHFYFLLLYFSDLQTNLGLLETQVDARISTHFDPWDKPGPQLSGVFLNRIRAFWTQTDGPVLLQQQESSLERLQDFRKDSRSIDINDDPCVCRHHGAARHSVRLRLCVDMNLFIHHQSLYSVSYKLLQRHCLFCLLQLICGIGLFIKRYLYSNMTFFFLDLMSRKFNSLS